MSGFAGFIGIGVVIYGLYLAYPPLGVIAFGLLLTVTAYYAKP